MEAGAAALDAVIASSLLADRRDEGVEFVDLIRSRRRTTRPLICSTDWPIFTEYWPDMTFVTRGQLRQLFRTI
jgi:hypothetical protein